MKVFELDIDQLQDLHDQTECGFFKCDDDHKVIPTMTSREDKYLYGVDRFVSKYPEIDISGLKQIEFVPEEIEI